MLLLITLALSLSTSTAFAATNTSNNSSSQTTTAKNSSYMAAGSPQVSFTGAQVNDASTRVKTFVDTNHRLPSYVTINTYQVTMPQFLQLISQDIVNVNSGLKTPVTLGTVNAPSSATETVKSGNIYNSEYVNMAKSILTAISSKGTAPSYVSSSLGNLKFESVIYTFTKILNYQAVNNRLPAYVSVVPNAVQSTIPPKAGEGVLRPVYIISDVINGYSIDNARINSIVTALKSLGISAYNYGTPGKLWTFLADKSIPSNALLVEVAGGTDAGSIKEKGSAWYQGLLGTKEDFIVFTNGATKITGLAWMPRAHDDNYDPPSFTGLAHPDQYLLNCGVGYFEGLTNTNISQCAQAIYNAALTK